MIRNITSIHINGMLDEMYKIAGIGRDMAMSALGAGAASGVGNLALGGVMYDPATGHYKHQAPLKQLRNAGIATLVGAVGGAGAGALGHHLTTPVPMKKEALNPRAMRTIIGEGIGGLSKGGNAVAP